MSSAAKSPAKPLYLSPSITRLITRVVLAPLGRASALLERLAFGKKAPEYPPVFVAGLPRAGTTLVYHALVQAYHFAYPPNPTNWLPLFPTFATALCKAVVGPYGSDFNNYYGRASGVMAPAEGNMWHVWFDNLKHQGMEDVSEFAKREAVRYVGRTERLFGAPFLNKCVKHDLRIIPLGRLFPEAVFIIVVRNPVDVAVSLLRGRSEVIGRNTGWLSVRPRNYDALATMPPVAQVCGQVAGILDDLADDMTAIGADRFIAVEYEHFVEAPRRLTEDIAEFLSMRGVSLQPRLKLPERFVQSERRHVGISEDERRCIEEVCADLFGDPPKIELPCRSI
jgi:hypothetical protein